MCNHRLKRNNYFRLLYTLVSIQHVSASLGHHQVYILLLNLLHCHLSMSRANALLFLILKTLKSLKVHKIADSVALHLFVVI
jgi:hypothetical protein